MDKKIKDEFQSWQKTSKDNSNLKLKEIDSDQLTFEFVDSGKSFSVTVPDEYPDGVFYVFAEGKLSKWAEDLSENFCKEGTTLAQLCTQALKTYKSEGDGGSEEEEDYGGDYGGDSDGDGDGDFDMDTDDFDTKRDKISPVEQELEKKRMNHGFLQIGSPAATQRLFTDLKHIMSGNPKTLGFSAQPVVHSSGKENLYEWEVRLFNFEGELAKDIAKYKSMSGKDYITISLKFSGDYPFKPPFVRVVEPRFQFRTGHVTLGGAICMQLLTLSGWTANNDVETIIIQIRAEIGSSDSGARLDLTNSGPHSSHQYSENEAWQAFYRAASTHGWKVEGLGPQMFPSV